MNNAILNCSAPYKPLNHNGSAADIIENWLAPHINEVVFTEVNIPADDDFPDQSRFDDVIVSGSEEGVYYESVWMQPLYMNHCIRRRSPISAGTLADATSRILTTPLTTRK